MNLQTKSPECALLTWAQMETLCEIPNLEQRIKRDIKDARLIAHCHLTGNWGPYENATPVEKERILFVIHNNRDLIEAGKPYVECIVNDKPII